MPRSSAFALCVAIGLIAGCKAEPEPSAEASTPTGEVRLIVEAPASVTVGDHLQLDLRVRNESSSVATIVRPVTGTWHGLRGGHYSLAWMDERGLAIRDPLGFAPPPCCVGDIGLTSESLVSVAAGEELRLTAGELVEMPEVMPSARPGHYFLRVEYRAGWIEGADPPTLRSAPIELDIVGGDAQLWACRDAQLELEANHRWATLEPVGFISAGESGWLIARAMQVHTVAGESELRGGVLAQRLDAGLEPQGPPTWLRRPEDELLWTEVAGDGRGFVLVEAVGDYEQRRLEARRGVVDERGELRLLGEPALLQSQPLESDGPRVIARPGYFAILHRGPRDRFGTLLLSVLTADGTLLGPRQVGDRAEEFVLAGIAEDDVLALWHRDRSRQAIVIQRFDAEGQPVDEPRTLEVSHLHSLRTARVVDDAIDLIWDSHGLGQNRTSLAPSSGASTWHTPKRWRYAKPWDDFAWSGDRLAAVRAEPPLYVFIEEQELDVPLSETVLESARLFATADGFLVAWADRQTDTSPACRLAGRCVGEVWAAALDRDAAQRVGPRQLTKGLAEARPFVPDARSWQEHCELSRP